MYYKNKIKTLSEIFGTSDIQLQESFINVAGRVYPIVDDVIILLESHQIPSRISEKIQCLTRDEEIAPSIVNDIQYTFGEEWKNEFRSVLGYSHSAKTSRILEDQMNIVIKETGRTPKFNTNRTRVKFLD